MTEPFIQKKTFTLMCLYKFVQCELWYDSFGFFIVMNKANLTMDSQINIYQKAYEILRFSICIHMAIIWAICPFDPCHPLLPA